ncbi:MAG: DUF418 domain-containing protein [Pseudomonadota bacterium]
MQTTQNTDLGPILVQERIDYLDVLRGLAVMAIFIVNIKSMVMPFAFYINSSLWLTETDRLIALTQKFLVDDKWRTIFTALYGAGLMMMWTRLSQRGAGRSVLFRRTAWLCVFGAVHLFTIWEGDILFIYGVTGLLAILFLNLKTRTLIITSLAILIIGTAWQCVFAAGPVFDPVLRAELKPLFWAPSPEQIAEEVLRQNGPIGPRVLHRAIGGAEYLLFYFLLGGFWLVTLGLMLCGMTLYRTGLLRGTWSVRVTLPLGVVLLVAAWGLDVVQVNALTDSNYDFDRYSLNQWMASLDGYLGGLAYCCLISALVSFGFKMKALQAVGRMAFTNYIACTLIGTTLGVGYGFGLYGDIALTQLMLVVALTFIAMLIWSQVWLNRFRFGPLEWLWRSLVYRAKQPMRRV